MLVLRLEDAYTVTPLGETCVVPTQPIVENPYKRYYIYRALAN
jgi:hypothetical protein